MSNLITVARTQQYSANVTHLFQQRGAKLRGLSRMETLVGAKQHFFERLGPTAAVKRTTRHTDTPLVNSQHSRRMVVTVDYEWADLVDSQDKLKMIIKPESEYAINAAAALGRAYDDAFIAAFSASARTGEDGGTLVTLGNDGATDTDISGAAVLTTAIMNAKTALDNGDVPLEDRYLLCKPEFVNQILANTTAPVTSNADYNTIRAIVKGELDTWVGFKWITSTRLPLAASTDWYNFCWQKNAMGMAIQKDLSVRIDERADKSYATQVYACGSWDGTRIQGEGVVRLRFDASL